MIYIYSSKRSQDCFPPTSKIFHRYPSLGFGHIRPQSASLNSTFHNTDAHLLVGLTVITCRDIQSGGPHQKDQKNLWKQLIATHRESTQGGSRVKLPQLSSRKAGVVFCVKLKVNGVVKLHHVHNQAAATHLLTPKPSFSFRPEICFAFIHCCWWEFLTRIYLFTFILNDKNV